MSEPARLLELIEDSIAAHGGDLGGWTKRAGAALQLFDGRVTLQAEVTPEEEGSEGAVHAHVFTTLHEHDDEVLEACLMGLGDNREQSLAQAAMIWMTCVAGPIRSFLDNKPVCMTCQAGVVAGDQSQGFAEGDYGLSGLRAYVGPAISRGFDDDRILASLDDKKPWFRYAAESAAPRRVHLVKVTILGEPQQGWRREMEIDGHEISYSDPGWPAGIQPKQIGYVTRFAVFEFPRNSREIGRRTELDRTIEHFAANYGKHQDVDQLMDAMIAAGFDADLVYEAESFATIAFGRALFEPLGATYCPTVIRARRDGRVQTNVPLMTIPAFTRARVIAARLRESMPSEEFQTLALYSAESNAIAQFLDRDENVDLRDLEMFPLVVPEHGVSRETMEAAMGKLHSMIESKQAEREQKKKPWWKFW